MPITPSPTRTTPTTKTLISTITTTATKLSSALATQPALLLAILTHHKTLSDALYKICGAVIQALHSAASRAHKTIEAANKRLTEVYAAVEATEVQLSQLRGRRAGLWEAVDNSLTKLSTFSEQVLWSTRVVESFYKFFNIGPRNTPSNQGEKRRIRDEFRESAKQLQEVDNDIRRSETRLWKLKTEEGCLEASVQTYLIRIGGIVSGVGAWERAMQGVLDVGVEDILGLVESFVTVPDGLVDATVDRDLPDGVVMAVQAYRTRWTRVAHGRFVAPEVAVHGVRDLLEQVDVACEELAALGIEFGHEQIP